MENSEKISVIVPVYKAEAYLDRCIGSITGQTYQNLEIILIDDGSPDNCPAMCDAWAEKDSRVRVIHQRNAGGGPARNAGLDIATGEIIAFVDSDDFLAPGMYAYLHSLLRPDVDIAECCITTTETDQADFSEDGPFEVVECDVETAMLYHIHDTIFKQTPPNKLYRCHTAKNVRFPAGTRIDDEFFTYRLLGNARKLVHSSAVLYAYRQQAGSLMHSMGSKRRMEAIEAKTQRHQYLLEHFPALAGESLKNLWFTCLYQAQLALREQDRAEAAQSITYIRQVLSRHPLNGCRMVSSVKEKIWLYSAALSLKTTCQLRNMLKIGL